MKPTRPGILAVRAVNQYRAREVMIYLGLRYYLDNAAARADGWAKQIATRFVLTRTNTPYFRAYHFKETDENGVVHRPIFVPCPSEALAEATLVAECAKHPDVFRGSPATVFSYRLTSGNDRSGMYERYFLGLKERQEAIADARRSHPSGVVRYNDIRRFYPSITTEHATDVWRKYSSVAGLGAHLIELGDKLIHDHGAVIQEIDSQSTTGRILTGPMFSHLIGNLVLMELDKRLSVEPSVRYLRYVDDVTEIGDEGDVAKAVSVLRECLEGMGLELHPEGSEKDITVSATDWLGGHEDLSDSDLLTVKIRNFLFTRPNERKALRRSFRSSGFRIPLKDYSAAALEASRVGWFRNMARKRWFKENTYDLSIAELVREACNLSQVYQRDFEERACRARTLTGFDRKRAITKLRYLSSRLLHLATDENLPKLASLARELPEMHLHSAVIDAVVTGQIDAVLDLGTNAAQITAQTMRATGKVASSQLTDLSEPQSQALAVFLMNGVAVEQPLDGTTDWSLLRFACDGPDAALMRSTDPFLREVACLHGVTGSPRHPVILETAFDEDEELTLDALAALDPSGTY